MSVPRVLIQAVHMGSSGNGGNRTEKTFQASFA